MIIRTNNRKTDHQDNQKETRVLSVKLRYQRTIEDCFQEIGEALAEVNFLQRLVTDDVRGVHFQVG